MTQIEQKTANAAAEATRMGVLLSEEKQPDVAAMPDDRATQVVSHTEQAPSIFVTRESFHVLQRQNADDILRRWAAGETLKQIAQSLGVSPAAITQWLDRNVTKEDREQARELHYQTKLDEGLEAIEAAADDMNLARAREPYLRRLEWRAQTECKRWQPKQHITHEAGPDLGDLLRDARKRVSNAPQVIDVTPSSVPPAIELDT